MKTWMVCSRKSFEAMIISQRRIVFYTNNGVCQHDNNILISMKEIEIKSFMKPLPIQHEDLVFVIEITVLFFFCTLPNIFTEKLQKWNLRFDNCIDKKSGYFDIDLCIYYRWVY